MTVCVHDPGGHDGTFPLYGTATERAKAWLLIEHPGPWPAYHGEMKMSPALKSAVAEAEAVGVRVQFIRRPNGRRVPPPLHTYAAWSAGSDVWIEGGELSSHAELSGLDLGALAAGRSPALGARRTGKLLLVCTHGRRSACCARLGRPLAIALAERFPEEVWETTHVGGHDFAANLVCLPHGLYYGRVGPASGAAVVTAYGRGEIALEHYRGRAGVPRSVQAAECFVREETGRRVIDDVVVESSVTGSTVTEALVRANGTRYRVVVEENAPARRPACGPAGPDGDIRYRLLDLASVSVAPG